LWISILLLPYGVAECVSLGAYYLLEGEGFSFERVARRRQASLLTEGAGDPSGNTNGATFPNAAPAGPGVPKYVPHPYLGFVVNPARFHGRHHWWIRTPDAPIAPRDDVFHVVLVGGSVAFNLSTEWDRLRSFIEKLPAARGKDVELFLLATAAYKQPQQLQAVTLYLALGGKIDLLLNVDGFNEVASEIARNIRDHVHPVYPSMWLPVTRDLGSGENLEGLAWRLAIRRGRSALARGFEPLGFSVTANLVWQLLDVSLERESQRLTARDSSDYLAHAPQFSRGPAFDGHGRAYQEFSAETWANASRVLADLAKGGGFAYFHFLQPNQYVPGAKPFTPTERKLYLTNALYQRIVPTGYRQLRESGRQLARRGVRFFDLSPIFSETTDTVFADDCCHMNALGRRLLADAIGRRIVDALRSQD